MSVLCLNVCRLYVHIVSLGMRFEKLHLIKFGEFAWYSMKIRVIFNVRFKRRKVDKKQTYTKTETCKLYSRLLWIFLPNVIIIDVYNFELWPFQSWCVFFLRQSVHCGLTTYYGHINYSDWRSLSGDSWATQWAHLLHVWFIAFCFHASFIRKQALKYTIKESRARRTARCGGKFRHAS